MRAIVTSGVAFALLAACGDNMRPMYDGVRGGSRLRATFVTDGDARLFTGFYDPQLDDRCTFQSVPGLDRPVCMPEMALVPATEFVDDHCDVPALRATAVPGRAPRFARALSAACTAPVIWQLGAPTPVAQFYTRTAAGSCAWHIGSPSDYWYPGVARFAIDQLVRGTAAIESAGQRLHVRYVDGDDGSRQPLELYDDELAAPCRFTDQLESGTQVSLGCYPDIYASGTDSLFDSSCRPLVIPFNESFDDDDATCEPTGARFAAVWISDPLVPSARLELWSVGDLVRPPVDVYVDDGATCSYAGTVGDARATTTVAHDWVTPGRTVGEGAGRLRPVALAGGGAELAIPWLHDTQLGTDCEARVASDGRLRCLPFGLSMLPEPLYDDDQCTRPMRTAIDTVLRAPVRWSIVDGETRSVFAIERELLPGTAFMRVPELQCIRRDWNRNFERLYVVGAEAAPERFAELSEIID